MKLYLLILILFISIHQSFAQYTYNYDFDDYKSSVDNELINKFNPIRCLTQIPDSGITGGCLLVNDDPPFSCTNKATFKEVLSLRAHIYVSLYFKFARRIPITYDKTLWIKIASIDSRTGEESDLDYIYAGFNYRHGYADLRVGYSTSTTASSSFDPTKLIEQHWYKLECDMGSSYAEVILSDCGLDGKSPPTLIKNYYGSMGFGLPITKPVLLTVTGESSSVIKYMDNVEIKGYKGLDIKEYEISTEPQVFPSPVSAECIVTLNSAWVGWGEAQLELSDMTGRILLKKRLSTEINNLDIASFPSGVYLMKIHTLDRAFVKTIHKI